MMYLLRLYVGVNLVSVPKVKILLAAFIRKKTRSGRGKEVKILQTPPLGKPLLLDSLSP